MFRAKQENEHLCYSVCNCLLMLLRCKPTTTTVGSDRWWILLVADGLGTLRRLQQ
jgi:hypothetical protein